MPIKTCIFARRYNINPKYRWIFFILWMTSVPFSLSKLIFTTSPNICYTMMIVKVISPIIKWALTVYGWESSYLILVIFLSIINETTIIVTIFRITKIIPWTLKYFPYPLKYLTIIIEKSAKKPHPPNKKITWAFKITVFQLLSSLFVTN